jgi:hypothetical protein
MPKFYVLLAWVRDKLFLHGQYDSVHGAPTPTLNWSLWAWASVALKLLCLTSPSVRMDAGAMLKAQRESTAKMVGGPFVPSSGVATARRLIANPVTLQSKDAETLQCEQRMIAQRSATNLAELNRTYKQNIGPA